MKTLLITVGLCAALVACGDTPEEHSAVNVTVPDYNPLPGGGDPGPPPCGRTYVIKFTTDAGTFTKVVPVYCNPEGDTYHGDPCPDCGDPYERQYYAVDPDPNEKQSHPQTIREQQKRERE
jgi:hypothetical protein